jgi:hypothetical protein
LQEIVDRVEKGVYKAKPAAVFFFDQIREAQRLMESNQATGKIVVKLYAGAVPISLRPCSVGQLRVATRSNPS